MAVYLMVARCFNGPQLKRVDAELFLSIHENFDLEADESLAITIINKLQRPLIYQHRHGQ